MLAMGIGVGGSGGGGGGTPGGSNTQIQYNNNGAFGGASSITTNGAGTLTVGTATTGLVQVGAPGVSSGTVEVNASGGATFPSGFALSIATNFTSGQGIAWGSFGASSVLSVPSSTGTPNFKIGAHNAHALPVLEQGTCTMVSGTCTFTWPTAFNTAPQCLVTWNGTGALTGFVKGVPSTTTCVVTSSVGTDTAVMQVIGVGNPD